MKSPRHLLAASAFLLAALPRPADAATYSWDGGLSHGGSADGNWSTANNWTGGVAPTGAADTDLAFAGVASRATSTNNLGDPLTLRSLTFQTGGTGYTLIGGALNLLGGIVQNSLDAQGISNTVNVTASQTWSAGAGAGALNLSGGLNVGSGAALGLNAGTVNVVGSMLTVSGATAATLNLNGSAALSANSMWVGSSAGGGGVVQGGGSLTVNGSFLLAGKAAGSYTLTGGTLSTGDFQVGYNAAGTFTQSGGSVTTSKGTFYLGYDLNGSGSYTLGGTGSTLSTGSLSLGNTSGTMGSMVVNGGTLTTGSGATVYIGVHGAGDFTQNGGTVDFSAANNIVVLANYSDGSGVYRLNGGVLQTGVLFGGNGASSTFYLNGGTVRIVGGGASAFMAGLTHAYVQAGGATIELNGNMAIIPKSFEHDPALGGIRDGGLTKQGTGTLGLFTASTYNGGTRVLGGTLTVGGNGALGTGNVTVQGATLSLSAGVTNAIADTAVLSLGGSAVVNLLSAAGSVQENVYELTEDGVFQPAGTYGAAGSGAQFIDNAHFSGTGILFVSAVPEPGSVVFAGAGALVLALAALRRRRRA